MKKQKIAQKFMFIEQTLNDMVDYLNNTIPINLSNNEDLINRVHNRYPILSKIEIVYIVNHIFNGMRELLVLGKVLNFNNLFFDTKLFFYQVDPSRYKLPFMKVKISTPPPMR